MKLKRNKKKKKGAAGEKSLYNYIVITLITLSASFVVIGAS